MTIPSSIQKQTQGCEHGTVIYISTINDMAPDEEETLKWMAGTIVKKK